MPIPRIAIVGRPNVGKSSLMNMLAKDKVSIVDPTPGVTRDRISTIVTLDPPVAERRGGRRLARREEEEGTLKPISVELTDTGGWGVYTTEHNRFNDVGEDLSRLTDDIESQISEAVRAADLVLFVVDAQAGLTAEDETVARLLRERVLGSVKPGRPARGAATEREVGHDLRVLVVANKTDGPKWEAHALEASALGFGEPVLASAKNNYMRRDLIDRLYEEVADIMPGLATGADEARENDRGFEMKVAIIGKRNAGKSTLVNALAGEERVIVSEIAGTTRDAVDVRFELDGRSFVAIDTAGLRKKKSFADRIEWFAYDRVQRSVARADVVMLLIDATEAVSQVDEQLAKIVQNAFKPCVIVVNKWDMVEGTTDRRGRAITPGTYEEYLRDTLKGLSFAPIALMSAQTGLNVRETVRVAFDLAAQATERVSTGKLNRLVRSILEKRGPSSKLGTFAKVYFVAQVAVSPPTIVLVVNRPELFTANYQRFLMNRFREELPFDEVPIKLIIRERKRASVADLQSGEYAMRRAAEGAGEAGDDEDVMIDAALEAQIAAAGEDAQAWFDDEDDGREEPERV